MALKVEVAQKLNSLFEETIVNALYDDFDFKSCEEAQEAIDHLIHRLNCLNSDGLVNNED